MIEIFSHTLAANEAREVALSGEYFEIRNAVFPIVLVEMMDRSGGLLSRLAAPEQSDFVRPGNFQTIRITNGPTAQTIKYFVGSGDAGSRRTSGQVQVIGTVGVTGNVSILDGAKSRTLLDMAMTAHMFMGASVGNFATVQLFNPLGSGKNMIVSQLIAVINPAFSLQIKGTLIPLTSPTTMATGSKKIGGGAGVAIAGGQQVVAALINQATFGINNGIVVRLTEPFVLSPGTGLNFGAPVTNEYSGVEIEYLEEPV